MTPNLANIVSNTVFSPPPSFGFSTAVVQQQQLVHAEQKVENSSCRAAWSFDALGAGAEARSPPDGTGTSLIIAHAAMRAPLHAESRNTKQVCVDDYQHLQQLSEILVDELLHEHGLRAVKLAGLAGLERWAAARARGGFWQSGFRRGKADGTRRALRRALGQTLVCQQEGCNAFVHLQSARKAAHRAGRAYFAVGDGCASRRCTRSHAQLRRFRDRQRQMAAALLTGRRTLVVWPPHARARIVLWAVPRAVAHALAHEVFAAQPPATFALTASSTGLRRSSRVAGRAASPPSTATPYSSASAAASSDASSSDAALTAASLTAASLASSPSPSSAAANVPPSPSSPSPPPEPSPSPSPSPSPLPSPLPSSVRCRGGGKAVAERAATSSSAQAPPLPSGSMPPPPPRTPLMPLAGVRLAALDPELVTVMGKLAGYKAAIQAVKSLLSTAEDVRQLKLADVKAARDRSYEEEARAFTRAVERGRGPSSPSKWDIQAAHSAAGTAGMRRAAILAALPDTKAALLLATQEACAAITGEPASSFITRKEAKARLSTAAAPAAAATAVPVAATAAPIAAATVAAPVAVATAAAATVDINLTLQEVRWARQAAASDAKLPPKLRACIAAATFDSSSTSSASSTATTPAAVPADPSEGGELVGISAEDDGATEDDAGGSADEADEAEQLAAAIQLSLTRDSPPQPPAVCSPPQPPANRLACPRCATSFPSRNALFRHLRDAATACHDATLTAARPRNRGGSKRRRADGQQQQFAAQAGRAAQAARTAANAILAAAGKPPLPPSLPLPLPSPLPSPPSRLPPTPHPGTPHRIWTKPADPTTPAE